MSNSHYRLIHVTDWLPTLYSAAGGNVKDLGHLDGVDQWRAIKLQSPSMHCQMALYLGISHPFCGQVSPADFPTPVVNGLPVAPILNTLPDQTTFWQEVDIVLPDWLS